MLKNVGYFFQVLQGMGFLIEIGRGDEIANVKLGDGLMVYFVEMVQLFIIGEFNLTEYWLI